MSVSSSDTIESIDVSAYSLEPDALRRIPQALAQRHDILSLSTDGNQLTVAIPDANDRDTVERVRFATGMHVRVVSATRESIRARLADAYQSVLPRDGDDAPAIRMLDEIHERAVRARASDIHIEPCPGGGRVRQRIDGILCENKRICADSFSHVLSRVKLLAGMDIADRRQPQDGRYAIETQGRSIDARVSSMPTISGEKLVVRLLDRQLHIPSLEEIGMPGSIRQRFRAMVRAPHGFIVVSGPTGSGKTTTLYAAMAERNLDSENLCSIEDPVEVRMPGIAQVQVNARAGVTFASALRAFLRQDPNAIMVGEMRDAETASVAASAALSGQLVLTTLHSNDAPSTIERLCELGVPRHTIAAGLSLVVAQRLVRRLCRDCSGGDRACIACAGTGYAGRIALFEMLEVDDAVRAAIAAQASSVAIAEIAKGRGYEPMLDQGIRRVVEGKTSMDELRRVLRVEQES